MPVPTTTTPYDWIAGAACSDTETYGHIDWLADDRHAPGRAAEARAVCQTACHAVAACRDHALRIVAASEGATPLQGTWAGETIPFAGPGRATVLARMREAARGEPTC